MGSTENVLQLPAGTRFNNYEVDRLLGHGGMGAAFLARDLALGRPIVVKVMIGDAAADPTLLERFRREAQAGALVDSEYVVKVYEAGRIAGAPGLVINGAPFISMQYVDGAPVSDLPKIYGRVPPELVTGMILGMARGLVAMHNAGIVHRDVKPSNALLCRDGRLKIADLGLAKFLRGVGGGPPPPDITKPGMSVGTAAYIAPEQAQGLAVDGRADVFALGVSFYELLTGALPFKGSSYLEMVTVRFTDDPVPPRKLLPDLPPEFERVCLGLMERDPERRPTSRDAVAMLQRLVPDLQPEHLAALFTDPKASTQLALVSTAAVRYRLEKRGTDAFVEEVPKKQPLATTEARSAPPAPVADGKLLPAALFAFGSVVLAGGAIATALILKSPAPPAPQPPPPVQAPPPPAPPTTDAPPRTLREAIATRRAASVTAFESDAQLGAAAKDARYFLQIFESAVHGLDARRPLDALLDALVAKRGGKLDDAAKAAANLVAAAEGGPVPDELFLSPEATGPDADRLKRVLGALGLARPERR